MEQADEIAQWHHDLEDALRSGAMSAKAVCRKIREILITIMSESDLRCFEEMERDAEQENYDQNSTFAYNKVSSSKRNKEADWRVL